ncbi:hypothetical protein DY000_02041041 [Brassica cretica]|uniref:Uncharacterized protein n=1 Tax=Brassica cretica TaxID=69181 RepID=A0ABQ7BPY7_BRACR|nr:hypothetical protein DY000_02041041 [Brassica cretica]
MTTLRIINSKWIRYLKMRIRRFRNSLALQFAPLSETFATVLSLSECLVDSSTLFGSSLLPNLNHKDSFSASQLLNNHSDCRP